ncbi:hypothetical protein [Lactococcus fujiensis]|uniref:Uncharacterized protein n=1 Tax=Lactococcus fujiensis JCM 16395 TaxID=1291764 RepID=A0A2A5RI39_9LACT|nr:hypothetical protein [Lactococcus fujiensis]PCR98795.1 hypothetical protein RT41_GL000903 [Lactococcus fujiensis JCM 16395]
MKQLDRYLVEHKSDLPEICEELLDEYGSDYEDEPRVYFYYNVSTNQVLPSLRHHEEQTVAIWHQATKTMEMLKGKGETVVI